MASIDGTIFIVITNSTVAVAVVMAQMSGGFEIDINIVLIILMYHHCYHWHM